MTPEKLMQAVEDYRSAGNKADHLARKAALTAQFKHLCATEATLRGHCEHLRGLLASAVQRRDEARRQVRFLWLVVASLAVVLAAGLGVFS